MSKVLLYFSVLSNPSIIHISSFPDTSTPVHDNFCYYQRKTQICFVYKNNRSPYQLLFYSLMLCNNLCLPILRFKYGTQKHDFKICFDMLLKCFDLHLGNADIILISGAVPNKIGVWILPTFKSWCVELKLYRLQNL